MVAAWDFSGMAEDDQLLHDLGRDLANSRAWPNWSPDSEFRATRDQPRVNAADRPRPEERRTRMSDKVELRKLGWSPAGPHIVDHRCRPRSRFRRDRVDRQPQAARACRSNGKDRLAADQGAAVGRLPDRRPDVRRPAQRAPHRRPRDARLPRQGADRQATVRPRPRTSDRIDRSRRPGAAKVRVEKRRRARHRQPARCQECRRAAFADDRLWRPSPCRQARAVGWRHRLVTDQAGQALGRHRGRGRRLRPVLAVLRQQHGRGRHRHTACHRAGRPSCTGQR